jgi:IS605 OrfB family transposase
MRKKKDPNIILRTKKYEIIFNDFEQKKIKLWLDDYSELYNETILYLKTIIKEDNYLETKEILNNWTKIRDNEMKSKVLNLNKNNMQTNSFRLAVMDACAMYKSAISNFENKVERREQSFYYININQNLTEEQKKIKKDKYKSFKFPDMKIRKNNRNRKVMSFEKSVLTSKEDKSGILIQTFNNYEMKVIDRYGCRRKKEDTKYFLLNSKNVKKDFKLQYDVKNNKYYLLIPEDRNKINKNKKKEKCGIDLGVRTFATSIDNDNYVKEIGKNLKNKVKVHFERIDRAQELRNNKIIDKKKYHKILNLNYKKIQNKIKNLEYKIANYYCRRYKIIHIGKVSTSSIKRQKTTSKMTKRLMNQMSFYKFIEILKHKADEYNTKIILINEYNTTKECSNCGFIKNDVGAAKIYQCDKCNYIIDRDVNAAINIYRREK